MRKVNKNQVWVYATLILLLLIALAAGLKYVQYNKMNQTVNIFSVENGVLIKYSGTDSWVKIPEDVIIISSNAFNDAIGIERITIGKNTKVIENNALEPLRKLSSIEVDEDNKWFESLGRVLISTNQKQIYIAVGAWFNKPYDFIIREAIEDMQENGSIYEGNKELVIGPARLFVHFSEYEGTEYRDVNAIEVYGQYKEFEQPIPMVFNGKFQAFDVLDCFVIAYSTYGEGVSYVFTKQGDCVVQESPVYSDGGKFYEDIMIDLYEKDGDLNYSKIPRKYYSHQVRGGYLQYCTSRDDVFMEEGVASIKEGKLFFETKRILTIDNAIDMNAEFEDWKETVNLPKEITLDEYLANNSKHIMYEL